MPGVRAGTAATRRARCPPRGWPRAGRGCTAPWGCRTPRRWSPLSTIRPCCITQTWSAMTRTTARSWRDEQVGQPELGLQVGEQAQDLRLHEHVEGGHRLVEHDDLGLQRERTRDRDALALAARQLVRVAADEGARQRHLVEQLVSTRCAARGLRCRPCACAAARRSVLPMLRSGFSEPYGSWNTGCIRLRRSNSSLPVIAGEVLAADDDLAADVAVLELQQHLRDGRLARAGLADERRGGALRRSGTTRRRPP